jgi:hypothetical protein
MPWEIVREGSALFVRITPPVTDWPAIFERVRSDLVQPLPYVVYLPPRVEGGSEEDAEQLRVLSDSIGKFGVVILPPP